MYAFVSLGPTSFEAQGALDAHTSQHVASKLHCAVLKHLDFAQSVLLTLQATPFWAKLLQLHGYSNGYGSAHAQPSDPAQMQGSQGLHGNWGHAPLPSHQFPHMHLQLPHTQVSCCKMCMLCHMFATF